MSKILVTEVVIIKYIFVGQESGELFIGDPHIFWNIIQDRDHPFSTYVKFYAKLTFLTPLIRTLTCAYKKVRNVSFSENLPTF